MENKVIDIKALPIPMLGKELGKYKGDTFELVKYEYGVLYHVYNSMDLIIRPTQTSAHAFLCDIIDNHEKYENELTDEERDLFELNISKCFLVLNAPLFLFSDMKLFCKVADSLFEGLQEMVDGALNADLKEEDAQANIEFAKALDAENTIKKNLDLFDNGKDKSLSKESWESKTD